MIRAVLSDASFSYDVHSLIQAFYPGTAVKVYSPEELSAEHEGSAEYCVVIDSTEAAITGPHGASARTPVPEGTPRTEVKNILKRTLYAVLSEENGRTLPWGGLTGIRPVKIPMKILKEGGTRADAMRCMTQQYLTDERSASLAVSIAERELRILRGQERMASGKTLPGSVQEIYEGYSLYVSIPFCPSICAYCSFPSGTIGRYEKILPDYLAALETELAWTAQAMHGKRLCSVYIGGGTPTALPEELFGQLLESVKRYFPLEEAAELTVEAGRPETILEPYLQMMKEYGVSRISVNPQTMQDATLRRVGRAHTAENIRAAFARTRQAGFTDINTDLIVGLPGETAEDVKDTVRQVLALDPEAITVHSLAKKRASRMAEEDAGVSAMPTEGLMDELIFRLGEAGYTPYYLYRQKNIAGNLENIGFAKEGFAGLYNILMMEEIHTVMACGAGAVTKVVSRGGERTERAANVSDITNYLTRTGEMLARKGRILSWEND